jgi:hypothetical protein
MANSLNSFSMVVSFVQNNDDGPISEKNSPKSSTFDLKTNPSKQTLKIPTTQQLWG